MKRLCLLIAALSLLSADTLAAERPATVLLVTSKQLADAWQKFADWKTRTGRATRIVTVAEIDQQYDGKDVQQKIRSCVLEHINRHGTRWVVLGGDSLPGGKGHVPDRDTPHKLLGYDDIPTDLYYLSEKPWDANNDGIYGDWETDRDAIAYTHDGASIGRIPVRTAEDVAAYTEKVIAYESKYPQQDFARTIVYTCPIQMAYPKLQTSAKTLQSHWKDCAVLQFFGDKTPWDGDKPGDHDLTPAHWLDLLNRQQAGKLHMHGHGFLNVWVLEGDAMIDSAVVGKLTNRDAFPIITTVSCFTGQFDDKQDPSITELMLRAPRAGAIAVVAPSREGVPIFSNRADFQKMITEGKMDGTTETMTRFWSLGTKGNLTIGEAHAAAKRAMADDANKHPGYHWCQCELNLLGDPTLDMRTQAPRTPKLKVDEELAVGTKQVTVSTDAPGATVCIVSDEIYEVAAAGKSGNATFSIKLDKPGTLNVSVSGTNLNVVERKLVVR